MPAPLVCGVIYLVLSALMLIPAIVPWAAVPLPTSSPTRLPTLSPTYRPSLAPSRSPSTSKPTAIPSVSPSTSQPTANPTTSSPSLSPTSLPTKLPTGVPTQGPSTSKPTASPSTSLPTKSPTTSVPSKTPTTSTPTKAPTKTPTTRSPSLSPIVSAKTPSISTGRRLQSSSGGSGDIRLLWLLWLWPCISFALMGLCYLVDDPRDVTRHRSYGAILLGKELDGSMRWYCVLLMLPVLLPLWLLWLLRHSTCRRDERPFDEVVPGIYLGRFPTRVPFCSEWTTAETFPAESTIIVDLVAEMPVPRDVFKTRRYICIPTLDQCSPNVEALREVGATLAAHDARFLMHQGQSNFRRLNSNEDVEGEGVRVKGSIYVFCANGRGRSASFLLVLLVMRGDCETVEQAVEVVRRARPQINPQTDQIQVAREAVAIWRAEQRGKDQSPPRGIPEEAAARSKRGNSNADIVEIPELVLKEGQDLPSTESRNVIALESALSDAKLQVGESFASRKRPADELEEKESGAMFYCVVPPVATGPQKRQFTLRITRSDLALIANEASRHLERETGGDLFGKAPSIDDAEHPNDPEVSVHHVIGPGKSAAISKLAFVQDARYLRDCMIALGDLHLDHFGDWHSHHGSDYPSDGDVETIANMLERTDKSHHVLIIANVLPGISKVAIAAYLFHKGSPKRFDSGVIQIIGEDAFDHDHSQRQKELELLKAKDGDTHKLLGEPEDDESQRSQPLPEPNLQSTESHNVIDLALS